MIQHKKYPYPANDRSYRSQGSVKIEELQDDSNPINFFIYILITILEIPDRNKVLGQVKKRCKIPNYTLGNLLGRIKTSRNHEATSSIVCLVHGVFYRVNNQAWLGTQIKEWVTEWGLTLLGTQICPRVRNNHLWKTQKIIHGKWISSTKLTASDGAEQSEK